MGPRVDSPGVDYRSSQGVPRRAGAGAQRVVSEQAALLALAHGASKALEHLTWGVGARLAAAWAGQGSERDVVLLAVETHLGALPGRNTLPGGESVGQVLLAAVRAGEERERSAVIWTRWLRRARWSASSTSPRVSARSAAMRSTSAASETVVVLPLPAVNGSGAWPALTLFSGAAGDVPVAVGSSLAAPEKSQPERLCLGGAGFRRLSLHGTGRRGLRLSRAVLRGRRLSRTGAPTCPDAASGGPLSAPPAPVRRLETTPSRTQQPPTSEEAPAVAAGADCVPATPCRTSGPRP
jgi:hypothetical protein